MGRSHLMGRLLVPVDVMESYQVLRGDAGCLWL